MRLFRLFRGRAHGDQPRSSEPNTADPVAPQDTAPRSNEYPEALLLAERHVVEQRAHDAADADARRASDFEDWDTLYDRHEAELAAYVTAMSPPESAKFATIYTAHFSKLQDAYAEELRAKTAKRQEEFKTEHPKAHADLQQAKTLVAEIERGAEVSDWVREAYARGFIDGRNLQLADDAARPQAIETHINAKTSWLDSLPEDRRDLSMWVHHEGAAKGRSAGAKEKLQKQELSATTTQSLTQVPLAKAVASASCLTKASMWDSPIKPINFLAGDLGAGKGHLLASGKVRIPHGFQDFPMSALSRVEVATQESVNRIGGAVGWGVVGATLFGSAGLVAGSLLGAKGTNITFVGVLKDGKRFLASARSDVYQVLLAAAFK